MFKLSSTQSLRVSLESVMKGTSGLNEHRVSLLNRAPKTDDWARFSKNSLTMKDLAFLTAKTGDEFAILRGKKEDILFSMTFLPYMEIISVWNLLSAGLTIRLLFTPA